MALLTKMTVAETAENVAAILGDIQQAVGDVPKPLLMQANSPGLFMQQAALTGYYRSHPNLEHSLLTCIRYLSATQLGYAACIKFNGNLLKKQGMTNDDLEAMVTNPISASLSKREVALLSFVIQGLQDSSSATPEQMQGLLDLGWTEADIVDAVHQGFGMIVHGRMMEYFQMEK